MVDIVTTVVYRAYACTSRCHSRQRNTK